jgi:hypothetical protein
LPITQGLQNGSGVTVSSKFIEPYELVFANLLNVVEIQVHQTIMPEAQRYGDSCRPVGAVGGRNYHDCIQIARIGFVDHRRE